MEYNFIQDYKISKMGMGTVQFGIDYGINNERGKVPYNEILKIFELAIKKGINFVDTSRLYGSSEKNIGKVLKELNAHNRFIICTKLDLSVNYYEKSDRQIIEEVKETLHTSLYSLGLDSIPIYLLHTPEHRIFRNGLIWDYLKEQLVKGLIGHLGVSISEGPKQAIDCFKDSTVEAIQIPYNIFDSRWRKSQIFAKALKKNVSVFTRSSFLQGLLVMPMTKIPDNLSTAVKYREKLNRISYETGIDLKELALKYVLSNKNITSTVVGIDSFEQFSENISLYEAGPLEDKIIERIEKTFEDVPVKIVNPALWSKQKEEYEKKINEEEKNESN